MLSRGIPVVIKNSVVRIRTTNGEWFEYNRQHRPLGAGAMGIVYMGYRCSNGEKVAIKEIRERYYNIPSIRERAKTEATLMFMHRNLIEMLGYCEMSEGHGPIWIVSRLIHGQPIEKFLKAMFQNRKLEPNRACQVFMPVLDALEYLHSKEIWHLDIKPSNIMVENGNNVRLMDLGISCNHDNQTLGSQGLMGTPNYAAPEQFNKEEKIDNRTDIYEAGVTLYELLTHTNPFEAETLEEVTRKHRTMLLPSSPNLPETICSVLRKAANPIKEQRYQDVVSFKKSLRMAMSMPVRKKDNHLIVIAVGVVTLAAVILCMLLIMLR